MNYGPHELGAGTWTGVESVAIRRPILASSVGGIDLASTAE